MQNASMSVQITIRDVPNEVKAELAARAALEGKSMQEYLREELIRLAEKPSKQVWLAQVRQRVKDSGKGVSAEEILEALHSGRDERLGE